MKCISTGRGEHRGFYKATNLPHFDQAGLIQSLTFRLADSLSPDRAYELNHGKPPDDMRFLFGMLDDDLDKGYGKCWLRIPEIADLIVATLKHFDNERYRLMCWVVMPNHVHCIIQQLEDYPLAGIVKSWKAYTAVRANRFLGRTGKFWQREYFDRYVRNRGQLASAADYIHYNPVAAGLCSRQEDWKWSSYRWIAEQSHR